MDNEPHRLGMSFLVAGFSVKGHVLKVPNIFVQACYCYPATHWSRVQGTRFYLPMDQSVWYGFEPQTFEALHDALRGLRIEGLTKSASDTETS